MRADFKRLIQRTAAYTLGRATLSCGVPVLTFHGFEEEGDKYAIRKKLFLSFLTYLKDNGYQTILTRELINKINNVTNQTRLIVITFDDGFASQVDIGAYLLDRYRFKATFFIASSYLNQRREYYILGRNKYLFMSYYDVKRLIKDGHEVGSHSHRHELLGGLRFNEICNDINKSIKMLKELTERSIDSFAYPFGRYRAFNTLIKDCLIKNEIKIAFTQMGYRANKKCDLYFMPRINIDGSDDIKSIIKKLNGHYDLIGKLREHIYTLRGKIYL